MPTVTIDGKQCEAQAGETIIRVAERNGIEIPSYCWHPALSIAANCRMCLVEVEKQPKLQPACQWAIADGMVVHTRSPKVLEARRAVMEYLLLNHPVDCPICDQAGECKLQNYWYDHDGRPSRLDGPKVHKPKAERFGPLVIYDAERCIRCTRCVRFCAEIAKDPVLAVGNRGNHAEIILDQGRRLDHAYSMMTAHICPVGALTTTDFRFQARVWMLEPTETICPGCATGCNAWIEQTRGVFRRMRPRDNPAVNDFWMCDEGCLTYKRAEEDRVLSAAVGRGAARKETSVAAALTDAARALGQVPASVVAVVLGSEHSSEDNFVLVKLARLYQKDAVALYLTGRPPGESDDLLRHADKNPNTVGAVKVADPIELQGFENLLEDAESGAVKAALVLGAQAPVPEAELAPLGKLDALVVLCSNRGPLSELATHLLPAASWAEVSGTFVNAKGMRQRFRPALPAKGDALPGWDLLGRLARKLDLALEYKTLGEVERAAAPAQVTVA